MNISNICVSIVTPTYNSADYLLDAIDSVIRQTHKNWELIIIDDNSTDETSKILTPYILKYSQIKYIQLEENKGAAVARTIGINSATGRYIAFLDSDDVWVEEKLAIQIDYMETHGINFSCTAYKTFSNKIGFKEKVFTPYFRANYKKVLLNCPIGNSTVMFNQEKLGKFEVPNIRKRNDDALWLAILKKEEYIYGISHVLMFYRVRVNSISSNKFELIKYHWILYRKIEKLPIITSIYHIIVWIIIKLFRLKG